MNVKHRMELDFITCQLKGLGEKLGLVANELENTVPLTGKQQEIDEESQAYINSKHINHSVGQIYCALEDISDALSDVRRFKHDL